MCHSYNKCLRIYRRRHTVLKLKRNYPLLGHILVVEPHIRSSALSGQAPWWQECWQLFPSLKNKFFKLICFFKGEAEENDENEPEKDGKAEIWEDIYGRKRDSQGCVIQTKYVPPAMRAAKSGNDTARLEKQLKGKVNKIVELHAILKD